MGEKKLNQHLESLNQLRDNILDKSKIAKSYECKICFKAFPGKPNLYQHKRYLHQPPAKVGNCYCNICKINLTTRYDFNMHNKKVHSMKKARNNHVKCEICLKNYPGRSSLKQHIRWMHTRTEQKKHCRECNKRFATKHEFEVHKIRHNGDSQLLHSIEDVSLAIKCVLRFLKSLPINEILAPSDNEETFNELDLTENKRSTAYGKRKSLHLN